MIDVERTYHFCVRDAPRSNNAGGGGTRANKFVAAREKRRWEGLFLTELMVLKAEPFMQFCSADVAVHFKHRHHRDEENFRQAVVKPLGDALQKGGYLHDDTREWFYVKDFRLIEGSRPWPFDHPSLTGYIEITLEAQYA